MTRGVPASTEGGPPAEGNIFAGSQWGGPESWDGPVWSEKYKKYITKKDQEFDDAAEQVAKRHAQQHDDGEPVAPFPDCSPLSAMDAERNHDLAHTRGETSVSD